MEIAGITIDPDGNPITISFVGLIYPATLHAGHVIAEAEVKNGTAACPEIDDKASDEATAAVHGILIKKLPIGLVIAAKGEISEKKNFLEALKVSVGETVGA